jgi:hypothetical protein
MNLFSNFELSTRWKNLEIIQNLCAAIALENWFENKHCLTSNLKLNVSKLS